MILIDTQKEEFSKLRDIRIFGKISHNDRFNGDLLVIGLGGAGSRIVCNLKAQLAEDITPEDNINFLMVDSDIPAMEATIEDSKEGVGFNATEIISIYRPNLEDILSNGILNNPVHPNLAKWMNPDFPNVTIGKDGAKGNRQVGRLMFSNSYEDIRYLLFDKLEDIYSKVKTTLDIIVVSSVCGGTGSGILSDFTYNIRAYAKAKKWNNVRIGGCLVMPDALYSIRDIYDDPEQMAVMKANGCATLKEIDYYMRLADKDDSYLFESTTHKLNIRENIFDSCILVSGKQDEQGYIPEGFIYKDAANFLYKLASNKYIGSHENSTEERKLLRDVFFQNHDKEISTWKMNNSNDYVKNSNCYYGVVSEADYKIPIREMENMCEYEVFKTAFDKLFDSPFSEEEEMSNIDEAISEFTQFLSENPGEQISLNVSGLVAFGQFPKPTYKMIKKNQDGLREAMAKKLEAMEDEVPKMIKSLKNKLWNNLDLAISRCMRLYGPYVTIEFIGSQNFGKQSIDRGMVKAIKALEEKRQQYQPNSEFELRINSIKEIVAKRFFAFPSAKRETEAGYFDACVMEILALERNKIIEAMDAQDIFGDTVRWLQERAERLDEIFSQFGDDLKNSIEDLASQANVTVTNVLKKAEHHQFLPYDYTSDTRINLVKEGLINFMLSNETNIDNGRVVHIKDEMEKIYRELFSGIGAFGPEKMISVAFSGKKLNEQDVNVMFGSRTNDRRDEVMELAAKAFVEDIQEEQQLCDLKDGFKKDLMLKKYISVPNMMPYFSKAVKDLLMEAPYNEKEDSITINPGEIEISIDDMYVGVPLSMMKCAEEMQIAYNCVEGYMGLHIDENTKDMKLYPDIVTI